MRRILASLVLAAGLVGTAQAQSSEFGIRGLGLPGRGLSARALALGGGIGLFDGESSTNPAAIGMLTTTTALFTTSGDYRNSTTPEGSLSNRDTRFPQILIGGPIPRRPFAIAVSYSLLTDRDFTVVTDGVATPRDVPVNVHDTLSSRGGIDDIQLGAAWLASSHLVLGAGLHFLTGSNRLTSRRYWEDTTYQSPQETAELSYGGLGVSVGAIWQPVHGFELAGSYRHNGNVTVDRDSTGNGQVKFATATIGIVPMADAISGAIRITPSPRLQLSGSITASNWSRADSSLMAQGSPGSANTVEENFGIEIFRDMRRPLKYPIRLGVRNTTLPFLLIADGQPKEFGVSIGTGRRFAQERGGFDIAIQHVWRSQGAAYHENATIITFGISVRPGGITP
ncbi:MAG TPA: hypothetical protein VGM77_13315 [Gemmatimonadales bacterium]|jgi:hypothetical protein